MIYLLSKYKHPETFSHNKYKIDTRVTVDGVLRNLCKEKLLVCDTETTGLNPATSDIIMLQFGIPDKDIQVVIDTRSYHPNIFKDLLESDITFVFQNVKFDYAMLKKYGIVLNNVYDTMLADQVVYNGKYSVSEIKTKGLFKLENIYERYFGKQISKSQQTTFLRHTGPFDKYQIIYGALDVVFPYDIYVKQQEFIKEQELEECVRLENQVSLALADMEINGILIDKNKWIQAAEENEKKLKILEDELDNYILQSKHPKSKLFQLSGWTPKLFEPDWKPRQCTVNWNSSVQILRVLIDVFDLYVRDYHGKLTTDAKVISNYEDKHPIIKTLMEYKKLSKLVDAFGKSFVDTYVDEDGRVRPSINQMVETGRTSFRVPNLQQCPRESSLRSAFVASTGYKLIVADFSGQEARLLAAYADDENFIDFFLHGDGDIHSFVATKLFSTQYHRNFIVTKNTVKIQLMPEDEDKGFDLKYWSKKSQLKTSQIKEENGYLILDTSEYNEWRYRGKTLNFMIAYGGSAFSLGNRLKIPKSEAQSLIDDYYAAFPKLREFARKCIVQSMRDGYILVPDYIKRRRWLREYPTFISINDSMNQAKLDLGPTEYRNIIRTESKVYKKMAKKEGDFIDEYNKRKYAYLYLQLKRYMRLKGHIERQSSNTPIQSSGGNMLKEALILVRNMIIKKNYDAKLLLTIHDEIVVECKEEQAEEFAADMQKCMEDAGAMFVKNIPMEVSLAISDHWEH